MRVHIMTMQLYNAAYKAVLDAVLDGYYTELDDLERPNYSEICDWIGCPDLQDGGYFEQLIAAACAAVLAQVKMSGPIE